ncbi:MAG: hypothetical protein AB9861_19125 [Methanosarcina sp.]
MKSVFSVWRLEGIRRPAGPPDNLGFCSPGPEVWRAGEIEDQNRGPPLIANIIRENK